MPKAKATNETLGERLRHLRKKRGLSQLDISGPGLTTAHISRIEAGLRMPSMRALRLLGKKLGVDPEYFERGSAYYRELILRAQVAAPKGCSVIVVGKFPRKKPQITASPDMEFMGEEGVFRYELTLSSPSSLREVWGLDYVLQPEDEEVSMSLATGGKVANLRIIVFDHDDGEIAPLDEEGPPDKLLWKFLKLLGTPGVQIVPMASNYRVEVNDG